MKVTVCAPSCNEYKRSLWEMSDMYAEKCPKLKTDDTFEKCPSLVWGTNRSQSLTPT